MANVYIVCKDWPPLGSIRVFGDPESARADCTDGRTYMVYEVMEGKPCPCCHQWVAAKASA